MIYNDNNFLKGNSNNYIIVLFIKTITYRTTIYILYIPTRINTFKIMNFKLLLI
jgi:hypothetical protein